MSFKRREEMTQEDKNYNRRNDPEIQKKRWSAIINSGYKLNSYEKDFISSVYINLKTNVRLSEPMANKLEEIYNKV
jgi:hypothetical protein